MIKALRVGVLTIALAMIPACAAGPVADPLIAATSLDQRGYALLAIYAATLEQAAAFAAAPGVPEAAKQKLAAAERVATPLAEALAAALEAYAAAPSATEPLIAALENAA